MLVENGVILQETYCSFYWSKTTGLIAKEISTQYRSTYGSVERDATRESIQCVTGNIPTELRGLGFPTLKVATTMGLS